MQIIAGKHRFQKLMVPSHHHLRPTSSYLRECLFNICNLEIENAAFLDLFAGCGAIGLEAMSRGASHATFVDNHPISIKAIQQNIKKLGEELHTRVIYADALKALMQLSEHGHQFDLIYADPPYHKDVSTPSYSLTIIRWLDLHPHLLKPQGQVFLEDSKYSFNEDQQLKHFILKSSRKMGISYLQQYRLK